MSDCGKRSEPMNVRHAKKRNRGVRDGEARERRRYSWRAGLVEDERDGKHIQRDEHEEAERRPQVLDVPETQRDESVWIRRCY
jgi:hypothetical protein